MTALLTISGGGWRQAGAYYGQFCGQFTARALASPGVPQSDASAQLLLGENDASAAAAMRLEGAEWAGKRTSEVFLLWVRGHVLLGHPVIIVAAHLNPEDLLLWVQGHVHRHTQ